MPCRDCQRPLFRHEKEQCVTCSLSVVERWLQMTRPLFFAADLPQVPHASRL